MKTIYIIIYNLKRNIRDRKNLANMLLLPIILILILGTALKNDYIPDNINKAQVYYCIEDSGEISSKFEKYITSDGLKDLIQVKKVDSKEQGFKSMKSEEKATFIYIDKNFSQNINQGKKSNISVYNERNTIQTEIVKNILDGFKSGANAVYAAYTIGGEGEYVDSDNSIIESSIDITGKIPKAIDYYAVTMLVMILMYGAFYGCFSINEVYNEHQGLRVQTTPISKIQILIGSIFSSIITVFISGVVLMLIAKYGFKANYGSNIGIILFIIFTMSVLSNFIGMTVAALTGSDEKASNVLNILIVVCTFVSGGYVKLGINTPIYNKIMNYVPNAMAHSGIFNSVYGSNMSVVISNISVMWIEIAICMVISVVAKRRSVL